MVIPAVALFAELSVVSGISIAARGTMAALEAAGVQVIPHDIDHPQKWPSLPPSAVNLVHTNPGQLSRAAKSNEHLRGAFSVRPTIGYWVWEGQGIPPSWPHWLRVVDELWVPSTFVANAVAGQVEVPVAVVPHPICPAEANLGRRELGLPRDKFVFLFAFNARSSLKRKNPLAVIRAYRAAFPDPDSGSMLVLKGWRLRPSEVADLRKAAGHRSDIMISNQELDAEQMASLIAVCDCYVSLHRAEGFGLSLAEAMYFGRPVVATAYSGNLDFMSERTAYLVDQLLRPIERRYHLFPAGTMFADPDEAQAIRLLRKVMADPKGAAQVGERGAAWVRANLSPAVVGAKMRDRIVALDTARPARVGTASDP